MSLFICVMNQVTICRDFTAENRVWCQAKICVICYEKVTIGQALLRVTRFFPVRIISPKLHTNISFIKHTRYIHVILVTDNVVKYSTSLPSLFIFSTAQQSRSGLGRPHVEVPRSHTQPVGLLWTSGQLVADVVNTTQPTKETKIHALSGTRTRDPSNQATAALRLTLHSHL
jgi:hypothetical protein